MTGLQLSDRMLALLVTVIIETTAMAAFSLLWPGQRAHLWRNVLLTAGMNVVSHAIFWTTLPLLPVRGMPALCGYEIAIVFVEGLIYAAVCHLPPATAAMLSLALNSASYWVGVLIWGWRA
jgi:hypothetical protein